MKKELKIMKKIFYLAIVSFITFCIIFISTACGGGSQEQADEGLNISQESDSTVDNGTAGETGPGSTGEQSQQVLEVIAKGGGYYPQKINAKAGLPTILVVRSQNAYGCERAFVLPQYKFSTVLPQDGDTKFELGILESGTKILGVCSMGMYYFEIFFE